MATKKKAEKVAKEESVPVEIIEVETPAGDIPQSGGRTWAEELEIAGDQLVARVKELLAESNVRRVTIRNPDNRVLLEIPLTAGVAVGGVLTFFAPVLAAVGALAALLAHVKVEIVRGDEPQ